MLTQVHANVMFHHDRSATFTDNRFVHLGETGLAFGSARMSPTRNPPTCRRSSHSDCVNHADASMHSMTW